MTTYCPVPGPVPTSPANRDYKAGFTAAMMLKDLKLAQDAAKAAGADTPLGADAAKIYARFRRSRRGAARFLRRHPLYSRRLKRSSRDIVGTRMGTFSSSRHVAWAEIPTR